MTVRLASTSWSSRPLRLHHLQRSMSVTACGRHLDHCSTTALRREVGPLQSRQHPAPTQSEHGESSRATKSPNLLLQLTFHLRSKGVKLHISETSTFPNIGKSPCAIDPNVIYQYCNLDTRYSSLHHWPTQSRRILTSRGLEAHIVQACKCQYSSLSQSAVEA